MELPEDLDMLIAQRNFEDAVDLVLKGMDFLSQGVFAFVTLCMIHAIRREVQNNKTSVLKMANVLHPARGAFNV